ncbi:MAG: MFS transporter [Candidatus Hodarchaeota archaeon]
MTESRINTEEKFSLKTAFKFGTGQLSDVASYQSFVFWIFTFYYTVVQLRASIITIAFVIWAVWNAFNDPLLGYFSDRTHTKRGRRIPWIMVSIIPLSVLMFLMYSPPKVFGIEGSSANFIYFFITIIVFEFFYTMFSLNQTSLFPEQFIDKDIRGKVNNVKQLYSVFGLIIAALLPSLFITDPTMPEYLESWPIYGIVLAIFTFLFAFIFIKWGAKEKAEFREDYKETPGFFESIKLCVKSKSFRWYIPAEIANWFVYGMLPTIIPLYGRCVLGIEKESILLSVLLGIGFISAAIFINFWRWVASKIGPRKAWMASLTTWIITLSPLLFVDTFELALITFFFVGIGLAGSMVLIDLIVADIIDEDEVNTGIRRDASYYGVNALFLRFSTVFVFLAISLVFTSVGWDVFIPEGADLSKFVVGLRILIFVFPAIAMIIAILSLYKYPLDGERLREVKEKLAKIHEEKKLKV